MRYLLVCLLLVMATGTAYSQGVNLAWDECGSGGATNKVFACSTNVGSEDLVASFVAPLVPNPVFAIGITLRIIATDDQAVPAWWMLGGGLCRDGSLGFGFGALDGVGCTAIGQLPDSVHINFIPQIALPNEAELGVASYYSPSLTFDQTTEYLAARIKVLNARTVGAGACAGCGDHATITLSRIVLEMDGGFPISISRALRQSAVTWEGGTVPTLPRSWGQIKALYH